MRWLANLWAAVKATQEQHAMREATLAHVGVDRIVRRTMDWRYGRFGWRVQDDMLEVLATDHAGRVWWGPVGPIIAPETRAWVSAKSEGRL